ncbi:MAG: hypothetical protein HZA36_00935 [Parcubacteria group bacterium]|nr:hypothetical protein [Parcubacteria group bacterium]
MNKAGFHIVRVGIAITFLWIGVLIFRDPEAWGSYLQPWAAGILPMPLAEAMVGTAFLDIAIGGLLLVDYLTWVAAALASTHLIIILVTSGITDITVRDIGLLAATLALLVESLPFQIFKNK